jgi:hypothetical protein
MQEKRMMIKAGMFHFSSFLLSLALYLSLTVFLGFLVVSVFLYLYASFFSYWCIVVGDIFVLIVDV